MSESDQNEFQQSERNRVRRIAQRGVYDRESVYAIVDEALICHVGFVQDGQPFVIPTIHARADETLYLHGAKASRMLKQVQTGIELCVTITLLDGLVLARSVFHHSMNYRSAVIFGRGRLVTDQSEKLRALEVLTEQIMPGRWAEARQPNALEMNATDVIAIKIESASAKVRTGPPSDDEEDYALDVWAGVVPIHQQFLPPVDDPRLTEGIATPAYVSDYWRNT